MKQRIAMKAFIVQDGKVLVVRESKNYEDGSHHESGFDMVGGRIGPGEWHLDAMQREITEEVGKKDVSIGRAFATSEWRVEKSDEIRQIVATFFVVHTDTDRVVLGKDHDEYKWIDPNDYKASGVHKNLWPVFEAYLSLEK